MGERPTSSRDQQDRDRHPHASTSGLESQLTASQPLPESHRLSEATAARSRVHSPRGTQSPRYTTQTSAPSRTSMALQRRVAASPFALEAARTDWALASRAGSTHWASGGFAHAHSSMWGHHFNPFKRQPSRSESESPPPATTQQQQETGIAPFHRDDGRPYTAAQVYTQANQPLLSTVMRPPHQQQQEEEGEAKNDDMEIDVLLDDASLDLLVATLARETARIEAASYERPHSVTHRQHHNQRQDEEDNQQSEQDHGDDHDHDDSDSSSDDSSHPSTPSTSSSGKSGLPNLGKGKAKKPKRVRRACVIPGCDRRSRSLGVCIAHGGGRRCAVSGCDKSSQGGNLCIKHGGGKRCSIDGCEKAAQTNSLCKAHGGGPRCQFGDCQKSSQGGGFCRQHGGGKRCAFEGCMKGTQRGSYCALHGGSRFCIVDGCRRNDRGGGFCAHHGGGRRCTVAGCIRPSRRNALCSTHLRVLGPDGSHSLDELNASIDQGMRLRLQATGSSSPSPAPSPSPPSALEPGAPPR